jgi:hypothetical protein
MCPCPVLWSALSLVVVTALINFFILYGYYRKFTHTSEEVGVRTQSQHQNLIISLFLLVKVRFVKYKL